MVHGNLVHGKRLFLILRPNTVRYVFFCRALAARRGLHFFRRDGCVARLRAKGRAFRPRDYGAKRRAIAEPKAIITCGSLLQRPKRHWQFTGPATRCPKDALLRRKRLASCAGQKTRIPPPSLLPFFALIGMHNDCGETAARLRGASPPAPRLRRAKDCAATAPLNTPLRRERASSSNRKRGPLHYAAAPRLRRPADLLTSARRVASSPSRRRSAPPSPCPGRRWLSKERVPGIGTRLNRKS